MFTLFCALYYRAINRLPRHRVVQLKAKIGKSGGFDNIFFQEFRTRNILKMKRLRLGSEFLSHSDTEIGHG